MEPQTAAIARLTTDKHFVVSYTADGAIDAARCDTRPPITQTTLFGRQALTVANLGSCLVLCHDFVVAQVELRLLSVLNVCHCCDLVRTEKCACECTGKEQDEKRRANKQAFAVPTPGPLSSGTFCSH